MTEQGADPSNTRIGYVVQNIGMDLTASKGTQIHLRGIARSIQTSLGRDSFSLYGVSGKKVFRIENPEDIGLGKSLNTAQLKIPLMNSFPVLIIEGFVRRVQRWLRLPYFGLWDNLRLYDGLRNLEQPDVILGHFDLVPLASTMLSQRKNVPLVVDCEADWFEEYTRQKRTISPYLARWARWSQEKCLKQAESIVCITDVYREHFVQNWSVPAAKIHTIPNSVDLELFSNPEPARLAKWQRRLYRPDSTIVIYVGGFYQRHGLDSLIESFSYVLKKMPAARLLLVGDGRESKEIMDLVDQLNMKESVICTGRVEQVEIPALLAVADVGVSPSPSFAKEKWVKELPTSPLKILEYMAAGLPVVVTSSGDVTKMVVDGENGLAVPPGDNKGFAQCILSILQDETLGSRLANSGLETVRNEYSFERIGEDLRSILQNAAG